MADGVLEMDVLLAPLAVGEGAGEDTRTDYSPKSPYQLLRNARGEARALERRLDGGDPEADPATILGHWREVKKLGISIIGTKSKDFEIASWRVASRVEMPISREVSAGTRLPLEHRRPSRASAMRRCEARAGRALQVLRTGI